MTDRSEKDSETEWEKLRGRAFLPVSSFASFRLGTTPNAAIPRGVGCRGHFPFPVGLLPDGGGK